MSLTFRYFTCLLDKGHIMDKIQNGTAVFPYLTEETTVPDTKKEEDWKDIAEERKLP